MSSRQVCDATVFVVDDDEFIRESLETLIRLSGWVPRTFASADLMKAMAGHVRAKGTYVGTYHQ